MSGKQKPSRKGRTFLLIAIGVLLAAAIGYSFVGTRGRNKGAPVAVSPTPEMTTSVQRSLEPYRGNVIILDIWATWCGPCRVEIPDFIKLQTKYRDEGLVVVGVSIDPLDARGGGAAAVGPFMQKYGINYPIWLVNSYDALAGYPPGQGIPTTYVLDRDGKIFRTYVGARPLSVFENDVKQLL
jgi:cytochrome c biogenesis protein CcmG/thiol:disulfide interchange protein DsbE